MVEQTHTSSVWFFAAPCFVTSAELSTHASCSLSYPQSVFFLSWAFDAVGEQLSVGSSSLRSIDS